MVNVGFMASVLSGCSVSGCIMAVQSGNAACMSCPNRTTDSQRHIGLQPMQPEEKKQANEGSNHG